jgi:hypothetical protein
LDKKDIYIYIYIYIYKHLISCLFSKNTFMFTLQWDYEIMGLRLKYFYVSSTCDLLNNTFKKNSNFWNMSKCLQNSQSFSQQLFFPLTHLFISMFYCFTHLFINAFIGAFPCSLMKVLSIIFLVISPCTIFCISISLLYIWFSFFVLDVLLKLLILWQPLN